MLRCFINGHQNESYLSPHHNLLNLKFKNINNTNDMNRKNKIKLMAWGCTSAPPSRTFKIRDRGMYLIHYLCRFVAKGTLSRKHEMVVKHVITKLYTLPKASF